MGGELVPMRYKQTEVGVIPEDWGVYSVGYMGEVVTGKALAVNAFGEQRPYLRTKNVFDGYIDIDDVLTMPMTDAQFSQFGLLHGDVLLNEGQSLELVGRCAIYQDEYPGPCAMQNQLLRFRAKTGVSALFSSHLFRYCQQTGVFARVALQTTSIAHLGGKRFENLLLPWPQNEIEQEAIATTLSDTDALIESLEQLIAKKRQIKQGAMQELLTGKRRLPGFGEGKGYQQSEVGVIPEDWKCSEIASLNPFITSGSRGWAKFYSIHGSPFIRITNMLRDSIHLDVQDLKFVQLTEETNEGKRTQLSEGDILVSITADVGIISYVSENLQSPAYINQHIALVRFERGQVNSLFVAYSLTQENIQKSFRGGSDQGAKAGMNLLTVGRIKVGLPTLAEQEAIATILSDMDSEIASLETKLAKTRQLKQGMMRELLTGRIRLVEVPQ